MDIDDVVVAEAVPMGNMLRCGCPLGRPCTCEMGNARRSRDAAATEYLTRQQFETLELGADCVLQMRRPDWNVHEKSAFYTRMRQLRLAMLESHAASSTVIETQRRARKKLNRDLVKAKEVLRKIEEPKKSEPNYARRTAIDYSHVDSDVFDSFSKQLIPAETLLPDVRARLEKVNAVIMREEKSIKIIRQYVQDVAATKLQQSVHEYLRQQRWRRVWLDFQCDVRLAAALTIQAATRMLQAKQLCAFLAKLRRSKRKQRAAHTICRFFRHLCAAQRADAAWRDEQARRQVAERKLRAVRALEQVFSRIACRLALLKWREQQRASTAHHKLRTMRCVVTIQRIYRGYRDRLYLKRVRLLRTLSCRVRALVDDFLRSGNLWGFVLEVDADYRRFEHAQRAEEEHALTFVSTLLQQRKREEDQMMHEWFTASAMQSPVVQGVRQVHATYSDSASPGVSLSLQSLSSPSLSSLQSLASAASPASSEHMSWPHALLEAPLATDLIALSPNKRKAEVFPTGLPPKVIRRAIAEGYALEDVVAVLRGLRAQMKDEHDVTLVLKTLQQRAPLMTNAWKPERVARQEAHPHYLPAAQLPTSVGTIRAGAAVAADGSDAAPKPLARPIAKASGATGTRSLDAARSLKSKPSRRDQPFITENFLDSIPGGMNASIARIVLVAAIKSFDPDANAGDGAFTLAEDFTRDPFQSYLQLESPLLKIRREHQVLEVTKPFVQILTENRCWTGYDLLYNVRGVDELVAWTLPRALALSIYDVLEQIHEQTARISRRNITREMFISPSFERFLRKRQQPARATSESLLQSSTPPFSKIDKIAAYSPSNEPPLLLSANSPTTDSLKDQIRMRLETDVLLLPLQRIESLSVADALFKAAFLVCETPAVAIAASTTTITNEQTPRASRRGFDAFLDALVALQSDGDTHALRALIRDRVDAAKSLADEHAAALKNVGVRSASDLVMRAHVVDARLDRALADKVRELLVPVAPQRETRTDTDSTPAVTAAPMTAGRPWGRKSRAALLQDTYVAKSTAQLSPLLRQGRIAISTLEDDEVDKVHIPF